MPRLLALPLSLLLIGQLVLALAFLVPDLLDANAFAALFAHPQFGGGLFLSLFTGISSTLISLLLACIIAARRPAPPAAEAGAMLAVPHLALALGVVFLIVPTGFIARLIATLVTGWTSPPQWIAAQDPYGLSLVAALVLKETPFLVWVMAHLLVRGDLREQLQGQSRVARALGHGPRSVWLRVVLPQILPRMVWPLIAVFAYGATVVDMALVTGPTQPPTLATVIWRDLNDADPATAARGAAGTIILSAVVILLVAAAGILLHVGRPWIRRFYTRPRTPERNLIAWPGHAWSLWRLVYVMVSALLILQSFSGHWPFPRLLAHDFSLSAWQRIAANPAPLFTSLALALTAAGLSLAAAVAWFETLSARLDRLALAACAISLCLPALMVALGQYRLFLAAGITGTAAALFLAHVLPVSAYVFVMLHGPYRGFDQRWHAVSSGLGQPRSAFLARIKWPLLKAPLLAAAAVGFAVSMAQFVPAQLAAAGRYATLPMETVTLSSGGNRPFIAASALLLMLLPLAAFLTASRLSRPRWSP